MMNLLLPLVVLVFAADDEISYAAKFALLPMYLLQLLVNFLAADFASFSVAGFAFCCCQWLLMLPFYFFFFYLKKSDFGLYTVLLNNFQLTDRFLALSPLLYLPLPNVANLFSIFPNPNNIFSLSPSTSVCFSFYRIIFPTIFISFAAQLTFCRCTTLPTYSALATPFRQRYFFSPILPPSEYCNKRWEFVAFIKRNKNQTTKE